MTTIFEQTDTIILIMDNGTYGLIDLTLDLAIINFIVVLNTIRVTGLCLG